MSKPSINSTKKVSPQCYAYTLPTVSEKVGQVKIGYTERDVIVRIKEQIGASKIEFKKEWNMKAAFITEPYEWFTDHVFHAYLKKLGVVRKKGEWFVIDPKVAQSYYCDFLQNHGNILDSNDLDEVMPYSLRAEQEDAVAKTKKYFSTHPDSEYLWNAKPRFGKTLTAYDLCKQLDAKRILIVTNRPAIANSWYSDYAEFFGPQSGLLFVSSIDGIKGRKYVFSFEQFKEQSKKNKDIKGLIEFVSLQGLKRSIYFGGTSEKLGECSDPQETGPDIGYEWDLLIVDEAHEGVDTYKTDTAFNHIRRKHTLHLSGTPFKALASEKFPEEAIYNWTYADEQARKRDWDNGNEIENPYASLPTLNLFTYKMSDIVRDKIKNGPQLMDGDSGEFAFDLNEFFATDTNGKFIHDEDVDKFLDVLTTGEKFPFSTEELRDELKHTFWLLKFVASVKALEKKLRLHPVFKDYKIIIAAGNGKSDEEDEAKTAKAFNRVKEAIQTCDKTITLSVGQLTTGVTIPEWTAVMMLSNMASPALYMQAAFRAQNPCLFTDEHGDSLRKCNAYVFDFDPARTLTIFEKFANDLIPATAGEKGTLDDRKNHVRQLLNFFPVYGEDDAGEMVKLDAEAVLTIPRHIHAKEVVDHGFMSNFLFANISGIFGAPKEIIDIINNMQPLEEPKKVGAANIDENTADKLALNENGEVEPSAEMVIGIEQDVFGDKVYGTVKDSLEEAVEKAKEDYSKNPKKQELDKLRETFSKPMAETMINSAQEKYGADIKKKSTQNQLNRNIQNQTNRIVDTEYGNYTIEKNKIEKQRQKAIGEAQDKHIPMTEISNIEKEYEEKQQQNYNDMCQRINDKLQDKKTISAVAQEIVKTVETEKLNDEKSSIEGNVRDHLRGFSRTIPAFLMAYGDKNTTLENFDQLVPPKVFLEVTTNPATGEGVTIDQFRMLRDGGDYYEKDENGNEIRDEAHLKHFNGHLFDEVVFNDAVQEFINKKHQLADYFNGEKKEDIFDYIPPQKTNQIFTPKATVKQMVDYLESENPGCFDQDDKTFADLYMKSGMYITEIVKRLYNSERLKTLYPDSKARLNHIFAKQVYGLAPTEIIYRICLSYILGFSDDIAIEKHNIKLCDALEFAKNNTLEMKLEELFPELKEG